MAAGVTDRLWSVEMRRLQSKTVGRLSLLGGLIFTLPTLHFAVQFHKYIRGVTWWYTSDVVSWVFCFRLAVRASHRVGVERGRDAPTGKFELGHYHGASLWRPLDEAVAIIFLEVEVFKPPHERLVETWIIA